MRFNVFIFPLIGFLFLTVSQAQAQLVVNGGFETGDFSGWTLTGSATSNLVATGFVNTGAYAAYFGQPNHLGTLSQSLATTAGSNYSLAFYFAGDGDTPSEFQALVDLTVLLDLVNPPFDTDYQLYTYSFTATSTSTLLSFKFEDDPNFINLDDVSVTATAVPEPGSVALLIGMSVTGAAYLRRRSITRTAA